MWDDAIDDNNFSITKNKIQNQLHDIWLLILPGDLFNLLYFFFIFYLYTIERHFGMLLCRWSILFWLNLLMIVVKLHAYDDWGWSKCTISCKNYVFFVTIIHSSSNKTIIYDSLLTVIRSWIDDGLIDSASWTRFLELLILNIIFTFQFIQLVSLYILIILIEPILTTIK